MSPCLEYPGSRDAEGYGRVKVNGKSYKVHRLIYEYAYGPFEPILCVCHHCDNPSCVNPAHLFVGTVKDNNDDKIRKMRHPHGSRHWRLTHPEKVKCGEEAPHVKLSTAQVLEIRARYATGQVKQIDLAKEFSIPQTHVSRIVLRQVWKHV